MNFMLVSGLVILRSLERFNYRARPFLIARAARIFPVFLPVFAMAVAVQAAVDFIVRWATGCPGSVRTARHG